MLSPEETRRDDDALARVIEQLKRGKKEQEEEDSDFPDEEVAEPDSQVERSPTPKYTGLVHLPLGSEEGGDDEEEEEEEGIKKCLEEMDEEPAVVDAILRSEVVEKMLGHVLYEGILEFIERADILGNLIKGLPIIGPLRLQAGLQHAASHQLGIAC